VLPRSNVKVVNLAARPGDVRVLFRAMWAEPLKAVVARAFCTWARVEKPAGTYVSLQLKQLHLL